MSNQKSELSQLAKENLERNAKLHNESSAFFRAEPGVKYVRLDRFETAEI
jgi:hypothetical protein